MSTRQRRRRRSQTKQDGRETNWLVIGGVIGLGVLALFVLLMISLNSEEPPEETTTTTSSLAEYCAENEVNCVEEGDSSAPVTVIEISDYGCGHCKNFNLDTAGILKEQYVQTGLVQWVTLPFALGDSTAPAAEASLCAAEQERFEEFHEAMFIRQDQLADMIFNGFTAAAEDADLEMDSFESCVDSRKYASQIQANQRVATQVGVQATPSFFINGELVRGNVPLANFQQQINAWLEQ